MSYWITEMRCKKCGTLVNVAGGVVGTQHMGPADNELKCPNDACQGLGYANFEAVAKISDNFGVPRHAQMLLWCMAEKGIHDAMQEVERMGADPLLTEAVVLLSQAKDKVAEFIDRKK